MKGFSIVAAMSCIERGIGYRGTLPWKIKMDMEHFKSLTSKCLEGKQNAILMGSKTWDSIPSRYRPLPGRLNVVLSRKENARQHHGIDDKVLVFGSLDQALNSLYEMDSIDQIFIIGGGEVYSQAISRPDCKTLHLTTVYGKHLHDTTFPAIPEAFTQTTRSNVLQEGDVQFEFMEWRREREPHPEYQYLDLIRECIESGHERQDRTGTGTLSVFGRTMRFSLRDNTFPLLTTKRTFWRGVVEELLWFISGDTDAKTLQSKGVHIWDGNGSRQYLDSIGLTDRPEGDLGPVYGFQWRHHGAHYGTAKDCYQGKGVDQIKNLIQCIKNNPTSRRMIVTAWNPSALHLMALPPCHLMAQFYVKDGELSCQMYQRSADMGLGVPFNIASYSLLTRMIAQVTGLKAGEFIHVMGDCHVYKNHIGPLKRQLEREPRPFPKLEINPEIDSIDGFTFNDFKITGYRPHPSIKMKMAV